MAKKRMVTLKLEMADGMQLRWTGGKNIKEFKAALEAVTFDHGGRPFELAIPAGANVVETLVPEAKAGKDVYKFFVMGVFEVPEGQAGFVELEGKKNVPC